MAGDMMKNNRKTTLPELALSFEDDPRVAAEQRHTEYAGHVVPKGARVGRAPLSLSMSGIISSLFWLFFGALATSLVGTQQAILGMVVSLFVFMLINWPLAKWGIRHGLDATLFCRRVFGVGGAVLIAVLVAANVTYYAVFESSAIAVALQHYVGGPKIEYWYLIVVLTMLPLMRGGMQTWLGKLNGILLPLFFVGLVASIVATGVQTDWSSEWLMSKGVLPLEALGMPGWLFVAVLYMGAWMQMIFTLEFSRFGREKDLGFHRIVTFGPVFFIATYLINGVAGIYLVQAHNLGTSVDEAGIVRSILSALGIWGLLFIIVTQVRINTLNFFVASMYWKRLADSFFGVRLHRLTWVGITSAVVFFMMLTNVFSYLQQALTWQGVFLVGWVGIVMTHFALSRVDRVNGPEFRPARLPRFTAAVPAWIIASGVGIYLAESKSDYPFLSLVAPLVTLVLSVVLYLAVRPMVSLAVARADARAEKDLKSEVSDLWNTHVQCHACKCSFVAMEMDRDPYANAQAICSACAELQPIREGTRLVTHRA
jgi:hypothetical protein